MKYCIYREPRRGAARIGAQSSGAPGLIIDVNRAEVVWLAARTGARRAQEVAAHLVPADPAEFLTAGASVWGFASEAVLALEPGAITPHGERVAVDAATHEKLAIVAYLTDRAERIDVPIDDESVPVAAIVGRPVCGISEDDAWSAVAAFVDVESDPLWLATPDELGDAEADVYCAVAELVTACSRWAPLEPGDMVCPRSLLARSSDEQLFELLLSV